MVLFDRVTFLTDDVAQHLHWSDYTEWVNARALKSVKVPKGAET